MQKIEVMDLPQYKEMTKSDNFKVLKGKSDEELFNELFPPNVIEGAGYTPEEINVCRKHVRMIAELVLINKLEVAK